MKIGTRISPTWLDSPDDLAFLKQIGVDAVDITLDICPGYNEAGGRANREGLDLVVERLGAAGLQVERANTYGHHCGKTFLDQPGWEREIENMQTNVELCGEFGFPVMGIQAFQAGQLADLSGITEYVEGRGGYRYARAELAALLVGATPEKCSFTRAGVGAHGKDFPPGHAGGGERRGPHRHARQRPAGATAGGVNQVLYDFAAFERLFAEVDSPNNGMTFCVGTIPADKAYAEMMPDLGDLDMYQVVRALHQVGYEEAIDYDHIMKLTTDSPVDRDYIAFCVGHSRGMLLALANE